MRLIKSVLVVLTLLSLAPAGAAADGCQGHSVIPGCIEFCQLGDCWYHVCCEAEEYGSVWGYCPGYGGFFENSCEPE